MFACSQVHLQYRDRVSNNNCVETVECCSVVFREKALLVKNKFVENEITVNLIFHSFTLYKKFSRLSNCCVLRLVVDSELTEKCNIEEPQPGMS